MLEKTEEELSGGKPECVQGESWVGPFGQTVEYLLENEDRWQVKRNLLNALLRKSTFRRDKGGFSEYFYFYLIKTKGMQFL